MTSLRDKLDSMNDSNNAFLGSISAENNLNPSGRSSINKYPPSVVFSKPSQIRKARENQVSFDSKTRLREALLKVFILFTHFLFYFINFFY